MENYTLYPIKKSEVDWSLYLLVKQFLLRKDNLDLTGDNDEMQGFDFHAFDDDATQDDNKYSLYLLFPSLEMTIQYNEEMLAQEVLVVKLYFPVEQFEPRYPGQIEPDEDDEVWYEKLPMEYYCFSKDGSSRALQHFKTQIPSEWPEIYFNEDAFLEALDDMIEVFRKSHHADGQWYERLLTTKRMVEGKANELHILHNAGLYDHESLRKCLKALNSSEEETETLMNRYVVQLKKYAMFVLNELDWRWGTCVDENDREERRYLFEAEPVTIEKIQKDKNESERRREIQENTARRQENAQKEKTAERQQKQSEVQEETATSAESADNRFVIAMLVIFAIAAIVVLAVFVESEGARLTMAAVGGLIAIIASRLALGAKGYKHRHSAGFRYLLTIVACILPFFFGWLSYRLMLSQSVKVPPIALFFVILVIALSIVAFCTPMRRRQTDERRMRSYTIANVVAATAAIGSFFAFIMTLY